MGARKSKKGVSKDQLHYAVQLVNHIMEVRSSHPAFKNCTGEVELTHFSMMACKAINGTLDNDLTKEIIAGVLPLHRH